MGSGEGKGGGEGMISTVHVPFTREFRLGSTGEDVVAVKRALSRAGFGTWTRWTNLFGPFAVASLRAFQRHCGMLASGSYDVGTHARLSPFFDAYGTSLMEKWVAAHRLVYANPYKAFRFEGVDQGIDWALAGKIGAIGAAVVGRVAPQGSGTGWPGAGDGSTGNKGAMITYQLTAGARKGMWVYHAENLDALPGIKNGTTLAVGQPFAHARGYFPYFECGWAADAHGHTLASTRGRPISTPTPEGFDFWDFVKGLP